MVVCYTFAVMPKQLNVAVVGCGYWGPNLARNFHQLKTAHLGALVDADLARAQELAVFYAEARAVANVDAVLRDDAIDALVIATPARTQYELTKRALEHGNHVV